MVKPIETLMQKEMTRKEFLVALGFGAASILGFSSILKLMGKSSPLQQQTGMGYGASAYGGKRST